jgi:Protein kinase domain
LNYVDDFANRHLKPYRHADFAPVCCAQQGEEPYGISADEGKQVPTPQVGEEFASYRIEALIGRGGMGMVYRAEQQRPRRKVALKLLAPELSTEGGFRERFIRESDLAAAIEHPNIIPIYEAGESDGQLFIAMRYVHGADLKGLVAAEGRLDPSRALDLIGQVGSALDVAHSKGLVHRDVKPHNMLIASGEGPESTDHVYLTDFGLTKHTASRSGLTAAGQFVGSIDYVAPEQIEGKSVDPRTDIYALGCVFYEAITGRIPFERDSEVSVMYAHLSDPPPTPSSMRPELGTGIDAVLAKTMAKSPNDRFASCKEFVAAAREELGVASGERSQRKSGETVVAPSVAGAAGGAAVGAAAGAAAGVPTGDTVTDAPAAAQGWEGQPAAAQGHGQDPSAQQGVWQGSSDPQAQWQGGGQPPGQGAPPPGGPSDPGWGQGPPPGGSGPGGGGGWQGGPPPGGSGSGGGGGWQQGPPPGGPSGPGWQQGPPPPGGPNKGLIYGIIGGLVVIALAVGAFLLLGGEDDPEPEPDSDPIVQETSAPPSPSVSVLESPSETVAVSPSPTLATDFPSPGDEEFLFTHIPTEIQPTCERQDPGLMPRGAQAGITCNTNSGADFVSYYKYATKPAMDRQYRISVSIAGATQDTGSCPTDIPAELSYTRAGNETVGRLVCYEFEGAGRIEWTNDKLLTYSEAVSLSGMSARLNNFWTTAGPLSLPQS